MSSTQVGKVWACTSLGPHQPKAQQERLPRIQMSMNGRYVTWAPWRRATLPRRRTTRWATTPPQSLNALLVQRKPRREPHGRSPDRNDLRGEDVGEPDQHGRKQVKPMPPRIRRAAMLTPMRVSTKMAAALAVRLCRVNSKLAVSAPRKRTSSMYSSTSTWAWSPPPPCALQNRRCAWSRPCPSGTGSGGVGCRRG